MGDVHDEIDLAHVSWKIKAILHEIADRDQLETLVCQVPECVYPGAPFKTDSRLPRDATSLTLDHTICRADGGPDRIWNLRLAHYRCNLLNRPKCLPAIIKTGEASRYASRAYTKKWVTCTCGSTMSWGPTYRRHIGKKPRRGHYPERTFEITRQNNEIISEVDAEFADLPVGRPGWAAAYWVPASGEWWISRDHVLEDK